MYNKGIYSMLTEIGRKNIREADKRLSQLLEITKCDICNKKKPLSEFAEDKNGYLGFSNICQECTDQGKTIQTQKKCINCNTVKNLQDFYKLHNNLYYEFCRDCTKKLIDKKAARGHTKRCPTCGEILPASTQYFYVGITCKDFLEPNCKACDSKKEKAQKIKRLRNKEPSYI